jgi:hypothetical protein
LPIELSYHLGPPVVRELGEFFGDVDLLHRDLGSRADWSSANPAQKQRDSKNEKDGGQASSPDGGHDQLARCPPNESFGPS